MNPTTNKQEPLGGDLHNAIMNLPCTPVCNAPHNEQAAYRKGHRDARHDAAELVSAALSQQAGAAGASEAQAVAKRLIGEEPEGCTADFLAGRARGIGELCVALGATSIKPARFPSDLVPGAQCAESLRLKAVARDDTTGTKQADWSDERIAAHDRSMCESESGAAVASDTFHGDDKHLCDCIDALLRLDAKDVLVPHRLGRHARELLTSAASRLRAQLARLQAPAGESIDTPEGGSNGE